MNYTESRLRHSSVAKVRKDRLICQQHFLIADVQNILILMLIEVSKKFWASFSLLRISS